MAGAIPGPVQVGSYFVGQYYQVLQQQPDLVHQFYAEDSTMIRIDGDSTDTATAMLQIHTLVVSLNFTAIEIKTINSLGSLHGGILVMVTGSVKTKDIVSRRKFVQTFFLAPQEKGFYVLNDIFQFIDNETVYEHPAPVMSENRFDDQLNLSSSVPEQQGNLTVPDYGLEEEAVDYVDSVHIEDDRVDKYSLSEQEQLGEPETEVVVEETPVEEAPASVQTDLHTVHDPPVSVLDEPVAEPSKKTYASILRVAKDQYASSVPSRTSAPVVSDWNQTPAPINQQQGSYATSYVPESGLLSYVPDSGVEAAEESFSFEEGEVKSVYVRNLPSTVTADEIEQEFSHFGKIKPDGIFIRNRKDVIGVCYAFVEFEDISGVQNAIQASPIHFAGRQVYIEERRPNNSSTSRGGRRGRGRGSYPTETSRGYQTEATRGRFGSRGFGRAGAQDSGEYSRPRGNGYFQRGY